MDAIGLALVSAALFGAMPVAVRIGYARPHVPAPAVVVLYMNVATFAVLAVAGGGGYAVAAVLERKRLATPA